jgi:hypothetical protein
MWRPDIEAVADKRQVWIPPGVWTDAWTGERFEGPREITAKVSLEQVPMFIRGGAVIPLAPDMQYTSEKPWDPVTLDVYMTDSREARTVLYEDDGVSNEYLKDAFRKTEITCKIDLATKSLDLRIAPAAGTLAGAIDGRAWRVRVHVPESDPSGAKIKLDQNSVRVEPKYDWRLLPRASDSILPLQNAGPAGDGSVIEIELPAKQVSQEQVLSVALSPFDR